MKRILYITEQSPFETYSGAHQRSNLLYKALCKIGNVDLICFSNDPLPDNNVIENQNSITFIKPEPPNLKSSYVLTRVFRLFSVDCIAPKNDKYAKIINDAINKINYDYIVIRYIQTALKCDITKGENVVIDVDDLPEQYFASLSQNKNYPMLTRFYNYLRVISSRRHTNIILKNIYHSFIPNKKQIVHTNTSYLPNIPFPSKNTFHNTNIIKRNNKSFRILFVGLMSWYPNYNGVEYFLKNIYPQVTNKLSNITFNIVGKNLPEAKKKSWEVNNYINIKGFVDNIEEEYKINDLVVIPIYEGAGSNIKVLEAMNNGKASVLSVHATRGFEDFLIDNYNTLIANNDEEFAEKIILALTDKQLNKNISSKAKSTISLHFSFDTFCDIVSNVII